jgi:hypothetical protein
MFTLKSRPEVQRSVIELVTPLGLRYAVKWRWPRRFPIVIKTGEFLRMAACVNAVFSALSLLHDS